MAEIIMYQDNPNTMPIPYPYLLRFLIRTYNGVQLQFYGPHPAVFITLTNNEVLELETGLGVLRAAGDVYHVAIPSSS